MKKLLPPVLFLLSVVAMFALHRFAPLAHASPGSWSLAGLALVVAGLGISIWHSRLFKRLQTNISTFQPPGKLVTQGMFRISRNPMYLGFALALLGCSIALGAFTPFLVWLGRGGDRSLVHRVRGRGHGNAVRPGVPRLPGEGAALAVSACLPRMPHALRTAH